MNFTSPAAIGGCGDDVLRGGLLIGRLLLQMFSVGLGCVLRNSLFGLQFSLTLRDNVVCLQDRDYLEGQFIPKATMFNSDFLLIFYCLGCNSHLAPH